MTTNLSQFDEAERVRQRMEGLRKHHNESTEIYNRTQPLINDQIHEETLKYLKSSQVKTQKPRAPKRQRKPQTMQARPQQTIYHHHHQQPPPQQQQQQQQQQPQQQTNYHHHRHHQPPPQQQQHQQPSLMIPPHHMQPAPYPHTQIEQSHYVTQHPSQQHYAQHQQQSHYIHQQQQPQQLHMHHFSALPNDLDFNLQAGLECDVDSLIKHEISVEGQLEFNRDLLIKLDNYYQADHQ